MNQDDWDLYLKSASNSGKRYQSYYQQKKKEEEDKKKNEIAFGGSDGRAATVEKSRGLWGGVSDFGKGVVEAGGNILAGGADLAQETFKSGKNLLDIKGEQDKEGKYQEGEKEINDRYKAEADERVWKGFENAASVDELPEDRQKAWEDIQARRTAEMGDYRSKTERGDSEKTNKLFDEQKVREEDFKKAGQQFYKGAQYIPGVSLGVEGAGTVGALIHGDDSEINKGLIELTQSKDWDKLTDEEKKAALTQRNIGGALSTLDVLPVAGKVAGTAVKTGVKTGMKSGIKAGLKEGIEAGGEAYGKSIASKTIKEVASVGAGQLAKQSAKSTAGGAGLGAGLGVGLNAVMGGDDWQGAAVQGAVGGAVGGFIGSPLDIDVKAAIKASGKNPLDVPDEVIDDIIKDIDATEAKNADEAARQASAKAQFEQIKANRAAGLNDDGSRFINLDETNKSLQDMQAGNYSDDLYDITTIDGKPVDPEYIQAATEKQVQILTSKRDELAAQIDGIADDTAREMGMANVNKLDEQIAAIKSGDTTALMNTEGSGIQKTLNPNKVRERFGQLQDDLAEGNFRQRQEQRKAEARTQPSRTYDSVSDDIDNVGAGGVAPEAVTPREDFVDIEELPSVEKLPSQLRYRAESLANDRREIEFQRSQLMTDERANQVLDQATDDYNAKLERIDMMPEPRKTAEMDKLQSEFNAKYEEVQAQLKNDAQTVAELRRVEEQINANSMELLTDANIIKDSNPGAFGKVDEELNQKIGQEIEQETETAIFNRMSNEDGVADDVNVSKVWAEAPIEKIDENLTSPEVGALTTESLSDTFTNDGVKIYVDNVKALDSTYTGLAMSSNNVVLEKIFGEAGKKVFDKIVRGYAHVSKANKKVAKTLTEVKKAFGGDKALYAKAVDVLEGKSVDLKDFSPAQVEAIGKVKDLYEYGARQVRKLAYNDVVHNFEKRVADGKIKYTADEIKQFAKRDGTTVKVASEKYGNVADFKKSDINFLATNRANNSTLDNYFPHMFDANGKELAFMDDEYVKSNGNVKFGNMLHRLADDDNYSRDIIDVSARYFSALNKKTYLEPALHELDNAKLAVKAADSEANAVWKWIDKYQAQLKYNKSDTLGKSWNEMIDKTLARKNPNNPKIGQNHYRSLLSTQRQINTLAALGLSFRNAIQQTTQIGTTIGNLGIKDTTAGMVKYLKQRWNPTTRKQYTELLEEHGITNAGIAKEAYSDLLADGISGAARSKGAKLSDALMIMTQKMDEFARGSAYEASKTASLRKGLTLSEANQIAAGDAARMNFLTSKVDMPLALNGDTVRSLSQFMTFSYKQAEAWKELGIKSIKNPKTGEFQLQPKEMSRLVQMMAFYGVAFTGMSQVAGIEPEDNIPFYGNIFGDSGLPKAPIVSVLFGRNESSPGLLEIVGSLANPEGDNEFEQSENRQKAFEDLSDLMVKSFVPAGSQIKKSVEGYNSTQNDGVVMKDDRVRFIQNAKPDDMLRNPVLFGQYATDDGKEWVNKKFPTLSEKQSEILNQQKDAESKERAYDFYSGLKSVGTKNTVTPKVNEVIKTQPNKAERLIREHNEGVQKAIEEYTAKYGELSEYEQDYLMQNYFITNGTLDNLSEED